MGWSSRPPPQELFAPRAGASCGCGRRRYASGNIDSVGAEDGAKPYRWFTPIPEGKPEE